MRQVDVTVKTGGDFPHVRYLWLDVPDDATDEEIERTMVDTYSYQWTNTKAAVSVVHATEDKQAHCRLVRDADGHLVRADE
tara:strand:- start:32688 stop:32930 length:243 start_codon:yes stop_codon:yes gene_type:complete